MSRKALAAGQLVSSLLLGLALGLAYPRSTCAAQDQGKQKDPTPQEEAIQAAKEDEEEASVTDLLAKLKKYQSDFSGTFLLPSDPSQKSDRGVVGTFITDKSDRNPEQTYLVKVVSDDVLKVLSRYDTKKVTVQGKLRNNGKYLIVSLVIEPPPPFHPQPERRSPGKL